MVDGSHRTICVRQELAMSHSVMIFFEDTRGTCYANAIEANAAREAEVVYIWSEESAMIPGERMVR